MRLTGPVTDPGRTCAKSDDSDHWPVNRCISIQNCSESHFMSVSPFHLCKTILISYTHRNVKVFTATRQNKSLDFFEDSAAEIFVQQNVHNYDSLSSPPIVGVVSALARLSCGSSRIIQMTPPPPHTHTHDCKALWVYSNNKCIIHSFIHKSFLDKYMYLD